MSRNLLKTPSILELERNPRSPAEARWRAAWTASKSHVEAWNSTASMDANLRVLTSDMIGGSEGFKVTHLSQVVPEEEVKWYQSPPFRCSPLDFDEAVIADIHVKKGEPPRQFLRAGPRTKVFHNSSEVVVAIATCGGLCPGLNAVIREVVLCLWYAFGVRSIYGVRYGYEGFYKHDWVPLTPETVSSIHHDGGTILGTSRGGFDEKKIIDSILAHKANQIYLIGGDGTHRGAAVLAKAILAQKHRISVVGIPKTIDNDIDLIDKSFGFDTAVEEAKKAITCAHVEAKATTNGVGIVVLMGRSSGFIALEATLASGEVNICLIPEVPFVLDGHRGLLRALKTRLQARGHCVIVVAEGAGMDMLKPPPGKEERDKSGNIKLPDIGSYLKNKIKEYFDKEGMELNMKYIDPSYMIRSVPANAADSVYTILLSQNAVYTAMAGFTDVTIAVVNNHYCVVPISTVTKTRKVDPAGNMWQRVVEITGQPDFTAD
eukprot:Phypoly_transcript_07823.p1 GENE.Phypoly_transcript_07823~~Phypoly_transcript_07823.p1  ORF type:complete len:489 (+),score=78.99 Phypoly_transcript_07823:118-1584(+)